MHKNSEKNPKEIQSVQRAIRILNCFDNRNTELPLAEISEMSGLNKSTVYGILYTLHKYGYIDKNPKNGRYCLGADLIRKSILAASANNNKLEIAGVKYLKRLTTTYSVTSYLFSYQAGNLICLEMLSVSNYAYSTISSVLGKKMAYHAAASGKVVTAHFTPTQLEKYLTQGPFFAFTEKTITDPKLIRVDVETTRRNGYGFENEEVDTGVSAISMPIYDKDGSLVGTISFSTQSERIDAIFTNIMIELKEYSQSISVSIQ